MLRENRIFTHETPNTPFVPVQGMHLFVADHKKVPFDFPTLCVCCKSVTASGIIRDEDPPRSSPSFPHRHHPEKLLLTATK
ncbi:hypothetical protein NQZ68_009161 [Dissostichus eleginoides]|nr:hypothetical protein NQZ68_009161 [Dissostichus eleginoides]